MHGACTYISPTNTLHCTDYHPCLVPRAFYAIPILHILQFKEYSLVSFLFLVHFVQHSLGNRWLNQEVFPSSQCLENSSSLGRSVNSRGDSRLEHRMRITAEFIRKSDAERNENLCAGIPFFIHSAHIMLKRTGNTHNWFHNKQCEIHVVSYSLPTQ